VQHTLGKREERWIGERRSDERHAERKLVAPKAGGNGDGRQVHEVREVGVVAEPTKLNLKSVTARGRRSAGAHRVLGFVLNDGTPLRRGGAHAEADVPRGQRAAPAQGHDRLSSATRRHRPDRRTTAMSARQSH
jgi:hypothetical protein